MNFRKLYIVLKDNLSSLVFHWRDQVITVVVRDNRVYTYTRKIFTHGHKT